MKKSILTIFLVIGALMPCCGVKYSEIADSYCKAIVGNAILRYTSGQHNAHGYWIESVTCKDESIEQFSDSIQVKESDKNIEISFYTKSNQYRSAKFLYDINYCWTKKELQLFYYPYNLVCFSANTDSLTIYKHTYRIIKVEEWEKFPQNVKVINLTEIEKTKTKFNCSPNGHIKKDSLYCNDLLYNTIGQTNAANENFLLDTVLINNVINDDGHFLPADSVIGISETDSNLVVSYYAPNYELESHFLFDINYVKERNELQLISYPYLKPSRRKNCFGCLFYYKITFIIKKKKKQTLWNKIRVIDYNLVDYSDFCTED